MVGDLVPPTPQPGTLPPASCQRAHLPAKGPAGPESENRRLFSSAIHPLHRQDLSHGEQAWPSEPLISAGGGGQENTGSPLHSHPALEMPSMS